MILHYTSLHLISNEYKLAHGSAGVCGFCLACGSCRIPCSMTIVHSPSWFIYLFYIEEEGEYIAPLDSSNQALLSSEMRKRVCEFVLPRCIIPAPVLTEAVVRPAYSPFRQNHPSPNQILNYSLRLIISPIFLLLLLHRTSHSSKTQESQTISLSIYISVSPAIFPLLFLGILFLLFLLLLPIGIWNGSESYGECDRLHEWWRFEFEASGSGVGGEGDRRFAGSVPDPYIGWRGDSASHAGHSAQRPSQEREIAQGIRRSTHRLHLQHRSKS